MGKNVNAQLAMVYEYNKVTTAQENQQNVCVIFVLCVFRHFNMFMLHFLVLILPFQTCFRFALNSFDMLLTFILIS